MAGGAGMSSTRVDHYRRYQAVDEGEGEWTVIDMVTGLAVLADDEPLVLLSEHDAVLIAALWNHNQSGLTTIH
jgi:hypothetical protein